MKGNGLNFATRPDTLRKAVAATRRCSICGRDVRASSLEPHENRHRVEAQTKACVGCGGTIRRQSRNGQKLWDEKRYCSLRCRARSIGADNRIPLSESYTVAANGCWEWTRHVNDAGYGSARMRDRRGSTGAHRIVWIELRGPIPDGLTLDHLCRNPRCVNPDHLEPVTIAENIRRAWAARKGVGHVLAAR